MKNDIATGGYWRLKRAQEEITPEAMAKKREVIEKKYKQLIAAAKPHEKEQLCERMLRELSNINHEPSAASLW
jgi:hypothetical protein